ncbi:MAG TPA: histidine phosphatase family protein [Anaerolineales bacterium]|nr:histidine phosphatase family protein [Anaerolineales bacterium]
MKPLILVKHSLPEIVEAIPAREWTLSEKGRQRARKLAELLIPYQPGAIACSVEPKARETAAILADNLGLAMQLVQGLHEHDRRASPYHSREDFQKLVQEFFEKPNMLVFGSETAAQSLARFREAVGSVLKSFEDKIIVIVAHGTVISLFVSWLTGCDGYTLWQKLGLPSFVLIDMESRELVKIENLP